MPPGMGFTISQSLFSIVDCPLLMPETDRNPRLSPEGVRCNKGGRTMNILVLLILLTSGLSTHAADYRRYINKRTRPLHDLLLKKQFLIIPNPPTCETNHLIRGYFISRYRAIYLCVDNLLEDPRLGDISGREKFNDARKQLSTTLTHEAVHAAQWCKGSKDWTLFNLSGSGTLGGFRDSALDSSAKIRGNRRSEKEAYLLESKPEIVMEAFDLYCRALSLEDGRKKP
jgi:hypothetical protein